MYWYKVKNMLIVLFAVLNVFLVAMIVLSDKSAERREKALADTLVSVLEQNDIKTGDGVLRDESLALYVYNIENEVEDSGGFAAKIMTENAEPITDENGNACYAAGTKRLYIKNGQFSMTDSAAAPSAQTEADALAAKTFFEAAGFDMSSARYELDGQNVVFSFYIDDMPVFDKKLYVKMNGGALAECSGCLLAVYGAAGDEKKEMTQKDALLKFLRDEKRPREHITVTDILFGYSVMLGDGALNFKYTEAIPAYGILTEEGNFYYN